MASSSVSKRFGPVIWARTSSAIWASNSTRSRVFALPVSAGGAGADISLLAAFAGPFVALRSLGVVPGGKRARRTPVKVSAQEGRRRATAACSGAAAQLGGRNLSLLPCG
jgi:hypothetical protein